jgi:hypothetical protein
MSFRSVTTFIASARYVMYAGNWQFIGLINFFLLHNSQPFAIISPQSSFRSSKAVCHTPDVAISFVKVKGKVVPVFLTEHHAMKTYWGVEV